MGDNEKIAGLIDDINEARLNLRELIDDLCKIDDTKGALAIGVIMKAIKNREHIEPGFCPKCDKVFFRERINQVHCSKYCRRSLGNKEYRDKQKAHA